MGVQLICLLLQGDDVELKIVIIIYIYIYICDNEMRINRIHIYLVQVNHYLNEGII